MFPLKGSCQRVIVSLSYDSFSRPLPELCLRRPKLLAITANDQRRLLLSLLFLVLVCTHIFLRTTGYTGALACFVRFEPARNVKHALPRRETSMRGSTRFSNFGVRVSPFGLAAGPTPHALPDGQPTKLDSARTQVKQHSRYQFPRRLTQTLKMCRRWNFTVCSLTIRRKPISALVNPSTQHNATCASRRLKFLFSTTR